MQIFYFENSLFPQVLLLLPCLVVLARSQSADWTCDECLEGGAALGDFLSGSVATILPHMI